MDVGLVFGAISLLGTLIAVAVAVGAHLRQFPRRRIDITTQSEFVFPGRRPELEPFFSKFKHPYLLTVHLRSASRADLPSSAFDNGRPVLCQFKHRIHILETSASGSITWSSTENGLVIPPQLIRPRDHLLLQLIAEGRTPTYSVQSSLVDIPIATTHQAMPLPELWELASESPAPGGRSRFSLIELLIVVVVVGILAAIAILVYIGVTKQLP